MVCSQHFNQFLIASKRRSEPKRRRHHTLYILWTKGFKIIPGFIKRKIYETSFLHSNIRYSSTAQISPRDKRAGIEMETTFFLLVPIKVFVIFNRGLFS